MFENRQTIFVGRTRVLCLLGCAVAAGCSSDVAIQPGPAGNPSEQSVLTSVAIAPEALEIDEGTSTQLTVIARNQRGEPMGLAIAASYSSSAPNVATVSDDGQLTALAVGSAEIQATVTIGVFRRTATKIAYVHDPAHSDEVALTLGSRGWVPEAADVVTGGTVRWKSDQNQRIYLMNPDYSVIDSVVVTQGSGVHRFLTPGVFRFCSGICWDPPDWGVVNVHQQTGGGG